MRRLVRFLATILLVSWIAIGVSAAVSVSSADLSASVDRDSSCRVTLMVTLHIDESQSSLQFPIPKAATSVKVNNKTERTSVSGDVRIIDLNRVMGNPIGDFRISISYTLPDVVYFTDRDMLELRIPLVSGFAYPIENMSFSVMLPGEAENLPTFESGYHQANIEKDIAVDPIDGAVISGTFTAELKDHETVTMKLRVSDKMFPQSLADTQDYTFALYGMAICGGLALLYWFCFLRNWPFRFTRTTEPLQGITAGEIGNVLSLQGTNLHLTVLTWARLGYIMLYLERGDKVILRKRMEMGNERKEEEQKLFRKLFAKGDVVDTRSVAYASLALSAAKKPIGMRERIHRHSGNLMVFRVLSAGIGLFGGICVAVAMTGGAFLQGLLIFLLGICGGLSGWYVPKWAYSIAPFNGHRLRNCGLICAVWLLLGLLASAVSAAVYMVLGMVVAGLFLAMGGRRTNVGKQAISQTLGLRNYLCFADKILIQRLNSKDPDYFFTMAPYAIALGIGRGFARRFGNVRLGACPYLTTKKEENLTAEDWVKRIGYVLDLMDMRARELPKERTVRLVRNMTKR